MSLASGAVTLNWTSTSTGLVTNVTGGGGSSTVFLESKDFAGDESVLKLIKMILFEIVGLGQSSLRITLKHRRTIEGTETEETAQILGSDRTVRGYRAQDIFFRIRIEDLNVVGFWKLAAIELWGEKIKGFRR